MNMAVTAEDPIDGGLLVLSEYQITALMQTYIPVADLLGVAFFSLHGRCKR